MEFERFNPDGTVREPENIPESLTCDRCEERITSLGLSLIAFPKREGRWVIAHKKTCADRAEPFAIWYELWDVFHYPVRYTYKATMLRESTEMGTPRALQSWFEAIEKIIGYPVFRRNEGEIEDPIYCE